MKSTKFPVLLGALALATMTTAVPANARWTPVRAEVVRDGIEALEGDINRADNNDTISEREAADLRARLASLRGEFRRMNANGLTKGEVRALQNRTNHIRGRLNMERVDWDRHRG